MGPELAVMGQAKVLQLPLAQLLTNRGPQAGHMQIKAQQLGFSPLPQGGISGLLVATGAAMPSLTFDLLTQVFLELQRHAGLPAREPLSDPLQVVATQR